MVLAVVSHLVLFTVSRMRDESPRYLVQLYLPLLFAAVIVLAPGRVVAGSAGEWATSATMLGMLVVIGVCQNVGWLRSPTVTDDVLLAHHRIVNLQTDGLLASRLIDFLRSQEIAHVRTGYFLQWRLLLESEETISASSEGCFPTVTRYPAYERILAAADRVAFIHHRESLHLQKIEQTGGASNMRRAVIDDYVVLFP
jgi:hypothetical protein